MKKKLAMIAAAVAFFGIVFAAGVFSRQIPVEESIVESSSLKEPGQAEIDSEYLEYYDLDVFETTLPVVFINTNDQRVTKENKVWATIGVLENPDGVLRSIDEDLDYESAITINYRGASSYSRFDKRQYKVKFYKNEGSTNAQNVAFLGMGKNSEWVLNGPFLDKSLMRNRLTYGIAKEIFEWAPDNRYVEVFVNGQYQGVYLAVEPVSNGESRLRLSEFGLLSGETAYIVKRDRVGTEDDPLDVYGKTAGKTSNDLYVEYPSLSDLTTRQEEWIEEDVSTFERTLYANGFEHDGVSYMNYIDEDNFVDYFVFNEIFMNNDAGNLSTYAYKELGGELMMAVWDYNNCLNNYQWFEQEYSDFFVSNAAWYARLLQDRNFVDLVVSRYRQLREGILSTEYVMGKIDSYETELGDAVERNFSIWGYTFYSNLLEGSGRDLESYEEAVTQLRGAYESRAAFLDEHITDLYDLCVN